MCKRCLSPKQLQQSASLTANSIELRGEIRRVRVGEHTFYLISEHAANRELRQFLDVEEVHILGLYARRRRPGEYLTNEEHLVDVKRIGWHMWMSRSIVNRCKLDGSHFESCLFAHFSNHALARRSINVCPTTGERPSTCIATLLDQKYLALFKDGTTHVDFRARRAPERPASRYLRTQP